MRIRKAYYPYKIKARKELRAINTISSGKTHPKMIGLIIIKINKVTPNADAK